MYAILSLGIAFDYLHYCYYDQALTAQLVKLSGVFMPKMQQTFSYSHFTEGLPEFQRGKGRA